MRNTFLFIFFRLLLTAGLGLSASNGEPCSTGHKNWICQEKQHCDKHGQNASLVYNPCRIANSTNLVCCPKSHQKNAKTSSTSIEMCKKYAESVYTYLQIRSSFGENDDGLPDIKVDSCAINFDILMPGSSDAGPKEFPHMAMIGYRDAPIEWRCVGSLISDEWIISTAHCSRTSSLGNAKWALLGDLTLFSDVDAPFSSPEKLSIVQIVPHPDYAPASFYNDIGLYRLERRITFNVFIRPICLHEESKISDPLALTSGWPLKRRQPDEPLYLKKACVELLKDTSLCNAKYEKLIPGNQRLRNGINNSTMICAWPLDNKHCQHFSSGWPLMIRRETPYCSYGLIGVLSLGPRECASNIPDVYTKISHFIPWIESVVWPKN